MRTILLSMMFLVMSSDFSFGKDPLVTCPVLEKSILTTKGHPSSAYLGKQIWFGTDEAKEKFAKDQASHRDKALLQLFQTSQLVQFACPIDVSPLSPEIGTVDFMGTKVGFCCKSCKEKFEKANDSSRLQLLFGKASEAFTLQSHCPVSTKDRVDIEITAQHNKKWIYFSNEKAKELFIKDPLKYVANLPNVEIPLPHSKPVK